MTKLLTFLLVLLGTWYFVLSTAPAALAQSPQAWSGRCVGTGTNTDIPTIQGVECLFYNILQFVVFFAGLIFLFMFISGGFKYLTSGDDEKAVAAAGSTLTSAIIGLIGIIASWLILSFIQKFTGINVTKLIIPG
ncbi:MAG: hypothetical protein UU09_C0049G0002 [Microgenomates group bacterium GW2011_GWA2_40_6]|nr:MAG: hypothetical protein UU09_C0049G0002 [Microgenomates group bacterium GW2011_GWA2_40_6]